MAIYDKSNRLIRFGHIVIINNGTEKDKLGVFVGEGNDGQSAIFSTGDSAQPRIWEESVAAELQVAGDIRQYPDASIHSFIVGTTDRCESSYFCSDNQLGKCRAPFAQKENCPYVNLKKKISTLSEAAVCV